MLNTWPWPANQVSVQQPLSHTRTGATLLTTARGRSARDPAALASVIGASGLWARGGGRCGLRRRGLSGDPLDEQLLEAVEALPLGRPAQRPARGVDRRRAVVADADPEALH